MNSLAHNNERDVRLFETENKKIQFYRVMNTFICQQGRRQTEGQIYTVKDKSYNQS